MSVITTTYTKDKQLSPHFALHEFLCKESKSVKYSTDLIDMLEKIFDSYANIGKAVIESGYRTPEYSVKVGGEKDDAHTLGIAADIVFYDKSGKIIEPKYIACIAEDLGFGGIGVMKNSVHLDVRHIGGYKNKKWWGDETKGYSLSANGKDFYKYYGLTKDAVYKYLQVNTTLTTAKTEMPKTEPPKVDAELEAIKKENEVLEKSNKDLISESADLKKKIETFEFKNQSLKISLENIKTEIEKIVKTI